MENNQANQVPQNQSSSQNLRINDSELAESTLGGQAGENIIQVLGNQAARDLVQIIIGSEVVREDKEKVLGKYLSPERLSELTENSQIELEKVQRVLSQARERVKDLRTLVENKIKEIKPHTSRNQLLNLIHELQEILYEKDNFEEILNCRRYDAEAALWLLSHLDAIVDSTTDFLFAQDPLPSLRENFLRKKLSVIELKERFSKTIATYISALYPFVLNGRAKVSFSQKDRNSIFLDFPNQIYISCLEHLKHGLIMSNYESGEISAEAANVVYRYINRFLIDQEFVL
ncbi:MAG: hypothetical protein AAF821_26935 [Cyanobacteria bacterium P01_D01_bin.156]